MTGPDSLQDNQYVAQSACKDVTASNHFANEAALHAATLMQIEL
jgi:hypothetical protein